MKKYILLFVSILIIFSGCSKNKDEKVIEKFKKNVNNSDSYSLKASMSIVSNEDTFIYDVNVDYLKENYYKVNLVNNVNNHEQVILKNDEGVYVKTQESTKQKLNVI